MDKSIDVTITKADTERGIVFGWAIISKQADESGKLQPYYDLQEDYIPEDTMLDASMEFMRGDRPAGEMHKADNTITVNGKKVSGEILYGFPLTEDICEKMDIKSGMTGMIVGAHVRDKEALQKFKNGEYTGFSIEGKRLVQDIIGDDGEVMKTEDFRENLGKGEDIDPSELKKVITETLNEGLKKFANRSHRDLHTDTVMGNKAPSIATGRKRKAMSQAAKESAERTRALNKRADLLQKVSESLMRRAA